MASTAKSKSSETPIEDAIEALRSALLDGGADAGYVDAHLRSLTPRANCVVPNLADTQRAALEEV